MPYETRPAPTRLSSDIELAPLRTVGEWRELGLDTRAGWLAACDMLDSRFRSRFFKMIDVLHEPIDEHRGSTKLHPGPSDPPPYRPAFAIMANLCLLIETLYQFGEGLRDTDGRYGPIGSKKAVVEYLSNPRLFVAPAVAQDARQFGHGFTKKEARVFYSTIRCGIYDAGELPCGSTLHTEVDYLHRLTADGNGMDLNRARFHRLMDSAFRLYVQELQSGNDLPRKRNFIKKMEYICGGTEYEAIERANKTFPLES